MAAHAETQRTDWPKPDAEIIREGVIGGLLGAVTIAVWFLIVDTAQGRPFFTPSILGTSLFRLLSGGGTIPSPEATPVSFGMVVMFSCIHGLTFFAVGLLGAWLLRMVDRDANYGFWVALLYITFAFWFTFVNLLLAGVVLQALSVPDILIAHLLAAVCMGVFYWKRHPNLASQF